MSSNVDVDVGVLETNGTHNSRGPFCSNANQGTMVSGYHRQDGGLGYDGINIYCGAFSQARFSSVMTFTNFAWSQSLGGSGWLVNLRQGATTLNDGGGNNGAGRTPHASVAENTNVFQAGREIYVIPATGYNAQVSQRPAGIAANTHEVTGNCLGTGISLANQIDNSCTLNVRGLPDIGVGITTPAAFNYHGQTQNVTVTGVNLGPGSVQGADGFRLITTLPAGWTATAVPGCTVVGQVVTCAITSTLAAGSAPGVQGGSVSFTFPVTVNAPTASGTYQASVALGLSTTNVDFNPANDSATGPLVLQLQPNFGTCDARMFLGTSNSPPSNTQLHQINMSSNPFSYTTIGAAGTPSYDAIGYNPTDNYIYGVRYGTSWTGNELMRIGSDGSVTNLGAMTLSMGGALPVQNYAGGAFSAAGEFYISSRSNSTLYRVNLATRVATPILTHTVFGTIIDFAFVGNDLYAPINNGQLARVNVSTGAVTLIGTATTGGGVPSAWGSPNGGLFGLNNGVMYQWNITTGTRIAVGTGATTGDADGTNCPNANILLNADLSVTKTNTPADGPNDLPDDTYVPGEARTYTIVVRNTGTFGAHGVTVSDPLPAGITSASWTCTATGGGVCAASGTGAINDMAAGVPVGAVLTYRLTLTVPVSQTGDLSNTVTVTPGPMTNDTNMSNNTATDVDQQETRANLSVTKTNSIGTVTSGGSTTYTIVATNAGPAAANNAVVRDDWTTAPGLNCSAGPATCLASGTTGTQCPGTVTPGACRQVCKFPFSQVAASLPLPCSAW